MFSIGTLLLIYAVMSGVTYGVYWFDKRRAEDNERRGLAGSAAGRRRVAERRMHTLELLGGWPGGLVAQRRLWHKVHSLKYQPVFWFIVGLHAGTAWWVVSAGRGPSVEEAVRAVVLRLIASWTS